MLGHLAYHYFTLLQAKGHTEASVKTIKHLIMKVMPSGNMDCEAFDHELLEVRNTPNYTLHHTRQSVNLQSRNVPDVQHIGTRNLSPAAIHVPICCLP